MKKGKNKHKQQQSEPSREEPAAVDEGVAQNEPAVSEERRRPAEAEEMPVTAGQLAARVAELEAENRTLTDRLQRLAADYANHQKRTPRQIAESVQYEKKAILKALLPSLDNFAHALGSARSAPEAQNGVEGIVKGIEMVFDHLLGALKGLGVEKIETVGQPFDPQLHEAMMQRSDEDQPNGVVLEEFQGGYLLNGQVLRPAKVIVNKTAAPAAGEDAEAAEEAGQLDEKA